MNLLCATHTLAPVGALSAQILTGALGGLLAGREARVHRVVGQGGDDLGRRDWRRGYFMWKHI